jgi:hypothetical protein
MKKIALFMGLVCVGLFVYLETSNRKNKQFYHDHDHSYDQDSEDIWWG